MRGLTCRPIIFALAAGLTAISGMAQQNQMQHFLKNLAIMGGLATVIAHGAGAFSVDALLARLDSRGRMVRMGGEVLRR